MPTTRGSYADEGRDPVPAPYEPFDSAPVSIEVGRKYALRNWRVRSRLVALILVPTLAAVGLAGFRVFSSLQNAEAYARTYELALIGEKVADLTTKLEEERDEAARHLASNRTSDIAIVDAQGDRVDEAIRIYQAQVDAFSQTFEDDEIKAQLSRIDGQLDRIPQIREAMRTTNVDSVTITEDYTEILDELLELDKHLGTGIRDAEITGSARALDALGRLKEAVATERGLLFSVLSMGAWTTEDRKRFDQADATRKAAQADLNRAVSPEQAELWNLYVSGPDIDQVAEMRDRITSAGDDLSTLGFVDDQWFQESKDELDLMRAVEAQISRQLLDRSDALQQGAQREALIDTLVVFGVLGLAFIGISVIGRSMTRPLRQLRTTAMEVAESRLPSIVRRLQESDGTTQAPDIEPVDVRSIDEIGEVARSFDAVHSQAVHLAVEQAQLRANVNAMFVNLSRRSQSLVERQLRLIERLENSEQDPDQLSNLFKLDHLATRMRRNGENLLVLAGEEPERRWSQSVPLVDVIRAAISEVEQYERIELSALPDVEVSGRAVNDAVHLLSELLENATAFSSGETRVQVTGHVLGGGGVMVEVEDAGIGMDPLELDGANEKLTTPPVIDVSVSRRMGLFVVGRLAHRHGIRVRLRSSAGGGIAALVALPPDLVSFGTAALVGGVPPQALPIPPTPPQGLVRPIPQAPLTAPPVLPTRQPGFAHNGILAGGDGPGMIPPRSAPLSPALGIPAVPPPNALPPVPPPPGSVDDRYPGARTGQHPEVPQTGPHTGPQPQVPQPQIPQPQIPQPQIPQPLYPQPTTGSQPIVGLPGPTTGSQPVVRPSGPSTGEQPVVEPSGPTTGGQPAVGPSGPTTGAQPAVTAAGLNVPTAASVSRQADVLDPTAPMSYADRDAEPIFAAIQSEWFRHRSRPAAAPVPPVPPMAPVAPQPEMAAPQPAAESYADADTPATGMPYAPVGAGSTGYRPPTEPPPSGGLGAPAPSYAAPAPHAHPMPEEIVAEENWASPGDEGWRAAEVVQNPTVAGYTPSGLPRRVPKTNLVPGAAGLDSGPDGAGRHAARSADEIRGRLSSLHAGTRRGRDASRDMSDTDEHTTGRVPAVGTPAGANQNDATQRESTDTADGQENG